MIASSRARAFRSEFSRQRPLRTDGWIGSQAFLANDLMDELARYAEVLGEPHLAPARELIALDESPYGDSQPLGAHSILSWHVPLFSPRRTPR